jgi:hypothetical protein
MSGNRIRRYEGLWSQQTAPTDERPAPGASSAPASTDMPPGFAAVSLAHFSPTQRQAIAAQADLYQRAYDQARREADEKFVRDWLI